MVLLNQGMIPQEGYVPETQQGYDEGMPFASPMPMISEDERKGIIESQLETEPLLEDIKNFLLGKQKDEQGSYVEVEGAALVNQDGMFSIINMIRPRLSKPVILGVLKDDEARDRARRFEKELQYQLVVHESEWDVKDKDVICDGLGDLIFLNFTRPVSGNALRALGRMTVVNEQSIKRENPEPPKGWFNIPKQRY